MTIPPFKREGAANPWHDVAPGDPALLPSCFDAVIEIPKGGLHKYELDKHTGMLRLNRVLHSAVHYPANYGFIPQTLADDGDPLDVLVFGAEPVLPLVLVAARAIGVMSMQDGDEKDDKIIAVHIHDPEYADYHDVSEMPEHRLAVLKRFFEDYKVLEKKKVVVGGILSAPEAIPIIERSIRNYERWKGGASAEQLFGAGSV